MNYDELLKASDYYRERDAERRAAIKEHMDCDLCHCGFFGLDGGKDYWDGEVHHTRVGCYQMVSKDNS